MNRFYIIRHGQTLDNVKQIIQGHSDSALTETGISSLIERAKKLKDIQFDEVFCSPLLRAKKSLSIIIPYFLYPAEAHYSDNLKEIDFGVYTKQLLPNLKAAIHYHKTNPSKPYPQGESGEQLIRRVCLFMDAINEQKINKTYLIVTHFGVLETLVTCYAGGSFEDINDHKDDIAKLTFYGKKEACLEWL
ncbi:MAG: histidine phosphatase family protein [Gammaproteobacteria bacterium]|nr:histidine phosphatase family protein [Gammaproteobacteria bacterium]